MQICHYKNHQNMQISLEHIAAQSSVSFLQINAEQRQEVVKLYSFFLSPAQTHAHFLYEHKV
jgi:hypothetical protein